ncbi:MAG: hypothetical protein JRE40_12910, partial [Deltaproteobacteria bacterium]|nr:hypothetical protein [Deltaproteobacteria bacterium]
MAEFPTFLNIPLADWIDAFMDSLLMNFAGVFDAIGGGLLVMLLSVERFFLWLPWWFVILVVGIASWWVMKKWWMGFV